MTSTGDLAAAGEEAGRQDARVVEDQEVAGPQQVRQVADHGLAQRPAVDQQQPRRVARADRRLRDQLGRQGEIEQVDAHGAPRRRNGADLGNRAGWLGDQGSNLGPSDPESDHLVLPETL